MGLQIINVNSATGNDAWTGENAAGGAPSGPKASIASAITSALTQGNDVLIQLGDTATEYDGGVSFPANATGYTITIQGHNAPTTVTQMTGHYTIRNTGGAVLSPQANAGGYVVRGCKVVPGATYTPFSVAVAVAAAGITLDRCHLYGMGSSPYVANIAAACTAGSITMDRCWVENHNAGSPAMIYANAGAGGPSVVIKDCIYTGSIPAVIWLRANGPTICGGNYSLCTATAPIQIGLEGTNAAANQITGTVIRNVIDYSAVALRHGILLAPGSSGTIVENCNMHNLAADSYGMVVKGENDVIRDCSIGSLNIGILFKGSTGTTLTRTVVASSGYVLRTDDNGGFAPADISLTACNLLGTGSAVLYSKGAAGTPALNITNSQLCYNNAGATAGVTVTNSAIYLVSEHVASALDLQTLSAAEIAAATAAMIVDGEPIVTDAEGRVTSANNAAITATALNATRMAKGDVQLMYGPTDLDASLYEATAYTAAGGRVEPAEGNWTDGGDGYWTQTVDAWDETAVRVTVNQVDYGSEIVAQADIKQASVLSAEAIADAVTAAESFTTLAGNVAALRSGEAGYIAAVTAHGDIRIVAGEDYTAAELPLDVSNYGGPSLDGCTDSFLRVQSEADYKANADTCVYQRAVTITQDGTTLAIEMTIDGEETEALPGGKYRHQIWTKTAIDGDGDGGGDKKCILSGIFTVVHGIPEKD